VHADVPEGPRGAAELGVDPPVAVGGSGEPILQVGAVEQSQGPGLPVRDPGAGLPDRGIEAVHEGDGRDQRRPLARADSPRASSTLVARGFSHTTGLPRPKGEIGDRGMQRVGRADVHHVDVVGGDQRLGGFSPAFSAKLRRGGRGPLRRGSRHTGDHPASGANGPGMHLTHEASTDDAGSNAIRHAPLPGDASPRATTWMRRETAPNQTPSGRRARSSSTLSLRRPRGPESGTWRVGLEVRSTRWDPRTNLLAATSPPPRRRPAEGAMAGARVDAIEAVAPSRQRIGPPGGTARPPR
jgi:hypothetical protein